MAQNSQDSQQPAHDKAFLMRSLGCTLARVNSPQFITEHLALLFRQTNHSLVSFFLSYKLYGLCSQKHGNIFNFYLENYEMSFFDRIRFFQPFIHFPHFQAPERVGCAQAMGHCASSLDHTDLVLTEMENIAKWEHINKKGTGGGASASAGIFSYIRVRILYL